MNAIRSIVDAARASTRELTSLLRREQGSLVDFLLALQPFDDRRLWAELGYASLFDFLHRELNLSKSAAYYRNAAVALVRKYPEVAKALADGKLCLSTVGEVGKVLEPENVGAVLPRFFHLSAREARELVAELSPHPTPPMREVVTIVRTVPAGASNPAPAIPLLDRAGWGVLTSGNGSVAAQVAPREALRNVSETRPAVLTHAVEPLPSDLRRVHFTVSKAWMSKLQAAKEALSHSIPHGDAEAVLERALDLLLEREANRRGLVKKPRAPRPAEKPASSIPAHVRREVTKRDEGKCQFKLHDGTICGSKVRTQLDHIHPESLGGPSTVENVRILCALHNEEAARRAFGDEWMDLFKRRT